MHGRETLLKCQEALTALRLQEVNILTVLCQILCVVYVVALVL